MNSDEAATPLPTPPRDVYIRAVALIQDYRRSSPFHRGNGTCKDHLARAADLIELTCAWNLATAVSWQDMLSLFEESLAVAYRLSELELLGQEGRDRRAALECFVQASEMRLPIIYEVPPIAIVAA